MLIIFKGGTPLVLPNVAAGTEHLKKPPNVLVAIVLSSKRRLVNVSAGSCSILL